MITGALFVPHPPLLVPALAGEGHEDLRLLRAACQRGLDDLLATQPRALLVLGGADVSRRYPADVSGSLRRYGVAAEFGFNEGGPCILPLSLTIGAYLLAQCDLEVCAYAVGRDGDAPTDELTRNIDVQTEAVGLVVLGDGSARRSEHAPGYLDERAGAFDAGIATALANGDRRTLAELDIELGDALLAAGPRTWRTAAQLLDDPCSAALHYNDAPFGVGYFVASWTST